MSYVEHIMASTSPKREEEHRSFSSHNLAPEEEVTATVYDLEQLMETVFNQGYEAGLRKSKET